MTKQFNATVAQDINRIHFVLTYAMDKSIQECVKYEDSTKIIDNINKEGFINYLQSLINLFHSHHTVEDDKIFPFFEQSNFSMPYEELAKQHEELIPLLDSLENAVTNLNNDFNSINFKFLKEQLENIKVLWEEHYQLEEKYLNDENIGQLIDLEKQAQLCLAFGQYAGQHINPDYLVIPFILFNLPTTQREIMSEVFPPVVTQELIPHHWKDKWESMTPFFYNEVEN